MKLIVSKPFPAGGCSDIKYYSMPKRKNLWYALFLAVVGGGLLRSSFFVAQRSIAILLLVAGVLLVLAAIIIFWKNFRE
jgi:hypothetical protein